MSDLQKKGINIQTVTVSFFQFDLHPLIDISIKSILISVVYVSLVYFLKLSKTINKTIESRFK